MGNLQSFSNDPPPPSGVSPSHTATDKNERGLQTSPPGYHHLSNAVLSFLRGLFQAVNGLEQKRFGSYKLQKGCYDEELVCTKMHQSTGQGLKSADIQRT